MERFITRTLHFETMCINALQKPLGQKYSIPSFLPNFTEDADFEKIFIDNIIVRVHQHAAEAPPKNGDQSMDPSRRGLTTKIHAFFDYLGILAGFSLTGAQASNTGKALPLFGKLKPLNLATENAYDKNVILQNLKSSGIQAIIPQ